MKDLLWVCLTQVMTPHRHIVLAVHMEDCQQPGPQWESSCLSSVHPTQEWPLFRAGLWPQGSCPIGDLSFVTVVRKISPFAKSPRYCPRSESHLSLLQCQHKNKQPLQGGSVRKINAVSLIPSPRSLSERQLLAWNALKTEPRSPVPALSAVLTSNSN